MKKLQSEATQKRIQDAVIELLLEKKYVDITIAEITKRSKINRTTFYLFYSSKEELVKDICFTFLDWYIEDLSKALFLDAEETKKLIESDFEKMKKDSKLLKALFNIQMNGFVPYLEMRDAIEKAVKNRLTNISNGNVLELVSKTYASSAMTTVEWWIDHCEEYTTDFVYTAIYTCVYEGLFKLLDK